MRRHRSADAFALPGLLMVVAVTLLAAVIIGVLAHVIGSLFRLLILFPVGMGFSLGLASAFMVSRYRVRAPKLVGVAVIVAAGLTWVADHGFGFVLRFQDLRLEIAEMATEIEAESGVPVPEGLIDQATHATFEAWGRGEEVENGAIYATLSQEPFTLHDGTVYEPMHAGSMLGALLGFARAEVHWGGRVGTYVLWGVELLIIASIATTLAVRQASSPACERCGNWYAGMGQEVPIARATAELPIRAALQDEDAKRLADMIQVRPVRLPALAVRFRVCPDCESSDRYAELIRVKSADKKRTKSKTILAGIVSANFVSSFYEEFERIAQAGKLKSSSS